MEILDSAANSIEAAFVISTGIAKWRFFIVSLEFAVFDYGEE